MSTSSATFAEQYDTYLRAGWKSPLPLPPGVKWPPPEGYTGWHGLDPSGADLHAWTDEPCYRDTSQLALRMPATVIGIDVDHYGVKQGALTLAEAERRWGPLPPAPISSARALPSGIRFYSVPEGTHLRTVIRFAATEGSPALGHIEVIQRHHRYAVAWPSVHPDTGEQYRWHYTATPQTPPLVAKLNPLPEKWIEAQRGADEPGAVEATPEQVREFMLAHTGSRFGADVRGVLAVFAKACAEGSARHDAIVNAACMGAREAAEGYYPAAELVQQLRAAFIAEMAEAKAGQRLVIPTAARAEFNNVWAWAVAQALVETPESREARQAARAARAGASGPFGGRYTGEVPPLSTVGPKSTASDQAFSACEKTYTQRDNSGDVATQGVQTSDDRPEGPGANVTSGDTPSSTGTSEAGADASDEIPDVRATSTWRPIDLAADWDIDIEPEAATMLPRVDGPCLIYPGRTHSIYAESESGKSWVALILTAQQLAAENEVLYIDHESDAKPIKQRLRALGVSAEQAKRLTYVRPEGRRDACWNDLLAQSYTLAVVDGVSVAIATDGASSNDTDETVAWLNAVPRALELRGAAVLTIDHVTKARDARGRYAIGSQQKLNAITGAAYTARVHKPFGRGEIGELILRVTKDRPGGVRPHCGPAGEHGTQEACRVVLDARVPHAIKVEIRKWSMEGDEATDLPFGAPIEMATSWRTDAAQLPTDVVDYDGVGRGAVRDLARYVRHAASQGDGINRTDAVQALRELTGMDGKPLYTDATAKRAWTALYRLGRMERLTTDPNGRHMWLESPCVPD